jgi:hypothetical protein
MRSALTLEAGVPMTAISENAASVGVDQTLRRATISKNGRQASGEYFWPLEQGRHNNRFVPNP